MKALSICILAASMFVAGRLTAPYDLGLSASGHEQAQAAEERVKAEGQQVREHASSEVSRMLEDFKEALPESPIVIQPNKPASTGTDGGPKT